MNHQLSGLSSYLLLLLASAVPAVMLSSTAGVAATLHTTPDEDSVNHSSSVNFAANLDEKLNLLVPSEENGNAIAQGKKPPFRQFFEFTDDDFVQGSVPRSTPSQSCNLQQVEEGAIAFASRPSAVETFRSLQNLG